MRRFVVGLLEEPGVIGEQIRLHADRERSRLRRLEGQIRALLEHEERLKERRERYLEQHAGGLITLEDAKAKVADLDKQKATVRRELDSLRESERYLADLDRLAEQLVRDLPRLLERTPPLREYETVPPVRELSDPGSLPIYTLTLDRIRHLSEEELAEKRHAAEEERRARYRAVYEDLRLSLTAHRDGTLKLRWAGGESTLEPQVLQERSVSTRRSA